MNWLPFDLGASPKDRPPQGEQILLWFEAVGDHPAHAAAGWVYAFGNRLDVICLIGSERIAVQFHGGGWPTRWAPLEVIR